MNVVKFANECSQVQSHHPQQTPQTQPFQQPNFHRKQDIKQVYIKQANKQGNPLFYFLREIAFCE